MNVILFEDHHAPQLYPFSLNHASFEIRCGLFRNIDRVLSLMDKMDQLVLIVRDELQGLAAERFPGHSVNPESVPAGMWLNGAAVWSQEDLIALQDRHSYTYENRLAAVHTDRPVNHREIQDFLSDALSVSSTIKLPLFQYLWDAVFHNSRQIIRDASDLFNTGDGSVHPSAVRVNSETIIQQKGSIIGAGAVLDATGGPIVLERGCQIGIGALIQGPAVIGADTIVNPGANLRGNVTLGPVCKVGGEVEDVIIHGFSNKQHDGFLGHSYLGEWVNLGANTNNSDLKNNYGSIRIQLGADVLDTGRQFLGAMIGDYSRTGISTMLNTGTSVGLGVNIFGAGFQDKFIPSFAWGKSNLTELPKFLKTCEIVRSRRGQAFSTAERQFLTQLHSLHGPA